MREEILCIICYDFKGIQICDKCNAYACKRCITSYLSSQDILIPVCLNCGQELDMFKLYDTMGKDIITEIYFPKQIDRNIKMEYQKLSESMKCVSRIAKLGHPKLIPINIFRNTFNGITISEITKNKPTLDVLSYSICELLKIFDTETAEQILHLYTKTFKSISIKQEHHVKIMLTLEEIIKNFDVNQPYTSTLQSELFERDIIRECYDEILYGVSDVDPEFNPKRFMFPCSKPNCRGFVSARENSTYACIICNTEYCDKCHEPKKENHECNPEDVKSVSEIMKHSKPCPKCSARIHKISGCSQMFCTNCKTVFDYTTGLEVKKGHMHNPHYLEWRNNHRGGNDFNRNCVNNYYSNGATDPEVSHRRKQANKVYNDKLSKIRAELNKCDDLSLFRLRCQYLLNRFSKSDYESSLKSLFKARQKLQIIENVYQSFVDSIIDITESVIQTERHNELIMSINEDCLKQHKFISNRMLIDVVKELIEEGCHIKILELDDNEEYDMNNIYRYSEQVSKLVSISNMKKIINEITNYTNKQIIRINKIFGSRYSRLTATYSNKLMT